MGALVIIKEKRNKPITIIPGNLSQHEISKIALCRTAISFAEEKQSE